MSTDSPPTEDMPLRQLAHDVKGQLAVVSMGLEALKMLRDDERAFTEVYDTIRRDGIDPLKDVIGLLIKRVSEVQRK